MVLSERSESKGPARHTAKDVSPTRRSREGEPSECRAFMSTLEQTKPAPIGGVAGRWQNFRSFLTEVRNEMRRVTWPSRREVYATTVVVILVSTFFGLYIWGIDLVLRSIVNLIYRLFGAV